MPLNKYGCSRLKIPSSIRDSNRTEACFLLLRLAAGVIGTILQMMQRKATTLGMQERTERFLAYMFFWLSGIFFLIFEKNRNVRWHALQSTIVFGVLFLAMFVVDMLNRMFSIIPILGLITGFGLTLLFNILLWVTIILWLWLMLMALLRPNYRLPFFGMGLPTILRK